MTPTFIVIWAFRISTLLTLTALLIAIPLTIMFLLDLHKLKWNRREQHILEFCIFMQTITGVAFSYALAVSVFTLLP